MNVEAMNDLMDEAYEELSKAKEDQISLAEAIEHAKQAEVTADSKLTALYALIKAYGGWPRFTKRTGGWMH